MLQKNKGYTLLFAVLVSSLVLAIAISILTISKKEFLLAASARDSSSAFYAADSALECTAYADVNDDAFNLTSNRTQYMRCNFPNLVFITTPTFPVVAGSGVFVYHVNLSPSGQGTSCARVTVTKNVNPPVGTPGTIIQVLGYNVGWNSAIGCRENSAKRVERAIEYKY